MVRALGYSIDAFHPSDPGRLCRGRERWVESLPTEEPEATLYRLVVSGATFSDETAADARRGLPFSGVVAGAVLFALFPGARFVAWCEEGHPRTVPDDAVLVEHYTLSRPGGALRTWRSRWVMPCPTEASVDAAVEAGADAIAVLDGPAAAGDPLPAPLQAALFQLTGFRQDGVPARRFQPGALHDALEVARAIVLIHLDKHGPSPAIYTTTRPLPHDALRALAGGVGSLAVPFAIPPMLARWDRALWELRQDWDEAALGEFPVPPAVEGHRSRRRRRASAEAIEE